MIKINLTPRELLVKERQKQYTTQTALIGALLLFFVVAASAAHWFKAARLDSKLNTEKQKLNALQDIVTKVQALEQQANAVRTRLNVITSLLKGRPLYPYFMMDIAETLPPGVWLTQMGTKAQSSNQIAVTASAKSSSAEGIATWLRNLQGSGKFSEPTLSAIAVSGTEGSLMHTFSITTNYHSPNL